MSNQPLRVTDGTPTTVPTGLAVTHRPIAPSFQLVLTTGTGRVGSYSPITPSQTDRSHVHDGLGLKSGLVDKRTPADNRPSPRIWVSRAALAGGFGGHNASVKIRQLGRESIGIRGSWRKNLHIIRRANGCKAETGRTAARSMTTCRACVTWTHRTSGRTDAVLRSWCMLVPCR